MSMTKKRAAEVLAQIPREELLLEEARLSFWSFCKLMHPSLYIDDFTYLRDMCDRLQAFAESEDKEYLILACPPRHKKSLTAANLTAWLFGQNPAYKVMTGSYNDTVSTTFARTVRNMIQTKKAGAVLVYADVFPHTVVKHGEASAAMWSLEGSGVPSYLATSPGGTATGFGCDFMLIDDIIKNAEEAYNQRVLDEHWSWFTNTMKQRLEGRRKTILIMTRWAKEDLAGRIIEAYGDKVEVMLYKAMQDDGNMLCDAILDANAYASTRQEMNPDIFEANYNQTPIDVKGRLYEPFAEWDTTPDGEVRNITDTADRGKDFLASVNYIQHESGVYITDMVYTDEAMEATEHKVAEMLSSGSVTKAKIESNNGGRGFARNVERILRQGFSNNRTVIDTPTQTANKESRILASSGWVQRNIFMPPNWAKRWPQAYKEVVSYQRKGVNAHDDLCDVLASIFEECTKPERRVEIYTESDLMGGRDRAFAIL
ncbi:phage terminase large subunit [Candidatus Saccharibacteria bacterium]|nr:phage terminase large subunit [Candidatus Saccharibacteria bacterium]